MWKRQEKLLAKKLEERDEEQASRPVTEERKQGEEEAVALREVQGGEETREGAEEATAERQAQGGDIF